LLSWHPQELQQLFCLDQPITHFLGVPIDGQTALGMRPQIMHKSRQGLMELNIFSWMKSLWLHVMINYKISSQLAKALNEFDLPYGEKIDILRGLCSDASCIWITSLQCTVGTHLMSRMTAKVKSCYWKGALWHQVTTVVILRKNMRQRTQTAEDAN